MAVGEGRADAPVGTTLAMIEQATKILNAVHKRMHSAQAEEFQLLARCFRENPESFWQRKGKPSYPWSEQTFVQALNDCELIPQADPNTVSQPLDVRPHRHRHGCIEGHRLEQSRAVPCAAERTEQAPARTDSGAGSNEDKRDEGSGLHDGFTDEGPRRRDEGRG